MLIFYKIMNFFFPDLGLMQSSQKNTHLLGTPLVTCNLPANHKRIIVKQGLNLDAYCISYTAISCFTNLQFHSNRFWYLWDWQMFVLSSDEVIR